MSTKLYHTEIGLPETLLVPLLGRSYKLNYSRHAINEMLSDKYGAPKRMPSVYGFSRQEVFEVEITDGWVTKVCVRIRAGHGALTAFDFTPSRGGLDLILVLVFDQHNSSTSLFVKTLWFNDSADNHATLDRSKYAPPV